MNIVNRTCEGLSRVACLFVTAAALLAGCGGGGGGGGSDNSTNNSLTFSADRSAVTFDISEGSSPSQSVVVSATGTYNGTLYVGAAVEGQGISPAITTFISGTQATFLLAPRTGLVPGDYTGRVLLLACSDQVCARQIGNSPIAVSYTVRVRPALKASPAQVVMSSISGSVATQPVTVQLPSDASTSVATVVSGAPWLSVSNATSTSFTVNANSLPSGTYSGSVSVTASSSTLIVPVTHTVAAPAGGDHNLSVSPTSLTLSTVESAQSVATNLTVTPPSWNSQVSATIIYPTGSPAGWLTLSQSLGGYQVSANAQNLSAGAYVATINLQGAYPSTVISVPVALTVGVGLVKPADAQITLDAESMGSALHGSVGINVVDGLAVTWYATSNAPWLILTTPSGTSGQSLGYMLDANLVSALSNSTTYTATVTVTPSRINMSPVTFSVLVNKRLPQITSIGPRVHLSGRPQRIVLRGTGFNSIANLLARFSIDGGSVSNVTRVNDTEVVVQVGPLSAGSRMLRVSNALGMPSSSSPLKVVTPQSYAYFTVPTGGVLRSLSFDAERNALYAANLTLESIMRFRSTGSNWVVDSVPLATAYDVGLSNDGTKLIAAASSYTTNSASIRLLDPDTLTSLSTLVLPNQLEPTFLNLGFGIQTTNDGCSWLAVGDTFANMNCFRADTLTSTTINPVGIQTLFYSGPWYALSRDGERLIVTQSASMSPSPPMLYMNAADSIFKVNPAGLTFSYRFSINEDGNRVLFDLSEVRDSNFNLIGRIQLPTDPGQHSYYWRTGQISNDGNRVYIFAYRDDYNTAMVTPRVFVYDSSTRQTTQQYLPFLGYFDVPDYPTCVDPSYNSSCDSGSVVSAITLDSSALFIAGNQRLIVAPIPAVLTQYPSAASAASSAVISTGRTATWNLRTN